MDTANLILFLDKLFDSLNSSRRTGPPGKPLKAAVTFNSIHIGFWYDAIKVLSTMKYFCHKKNKFVTVPSLKNLIFTIKGFIYLSQNILKKYPNKYVTVRTFQQDSLENFFGCIRAHSVRENMPSASHFVCSFKALITNNFLSTHSPGANCEKDVSEGVLENLHNFVTSKVMDGINTLNEEIVEPEIPSILIKQKRSFISKCTSTYIAGFIAKKVLKKIKCNQCKNNILKSHSEANMDFIKARQYKNSHLTKPGSYFYFLVVSQSVSRLFYLIPRIL